MNTLVPFRDEITFVSDEFVQKMNKFLNFVTANSFSALLPLFVKEVRCLPTLPVVKVTKDLVCRRANSDHAGEQRDHSHWGVGFLQSYQLYSDFVPKILALRTCHEKRGKTQRMFAKITQRVFAR